jgi:DNA-binding NarL/FixJ family response regulator
MQRIFFSTDINTLDEWKQRDTASESVACSTSDDLQNIAKESIVIADYDSVAPEINKMITSNALPANMIVLEREPELLTGKMLLSHGIKAYGNSRMLKNHYQQMIETVTKGKVWTYPSLTSFLIRNNKKSTLNQYSLDLLEKRLSVQEIEVTKLILDGLTNDAIASLLNITTRTVKAHITSIFIKLHVNDRLSLVLLLK